MSCPGQLKTPDIYKETDIYFFLEMVSILARAVSIMNKMKARKTIVSLVWYLLIGWAVWIIVNFIEKTVSA